MLGIRMIIKKVSVNNNYRKACDKIFTDNYHSVMIK